MPPSDALPTKSQLRNERKKRQRQLRSIRDAIQKNHIDRLERELSVTQDSAKKSAAEIASLKLANDKLQNIAQSAVLDAFIFQRSAESHVRTIVERDRTIATLSAPAAAASPK
jgi:chromosome segregation ATPase